MYPHLANEWSKKKLQIKAEEVSPYSTQNVWWKCSVCGYEWQLMIRKRIKNSICPVCADKAVLTGVNDLTTTNHALLAEWDYKRNTSVTPEHMSKHSLRVVWWKCSRGHHFRARIADRAVDGEPCHICRKEFEKVFPDLLLREYINKSGFSVIEKEEDLIGIPLLCYIPEKRAVIEVSKPDYNLKDAYTRECVKNILCKKKKIRLIRIIRKTDKDFRDCACIRLFDYSDESLDEGIHLALKTLGIKVEGLGDKTSEENSGNISESIKDRKQRLFEKWLKS